MHGSLRHFTAYIRLPVVSQWDQFLGSPDCTLSIAGPNGDLGRMGIGAGGSLTLGRKGAWVGRVSGAEGSLATPDRRIHDRFQPGF